MKLRHIRNCKGGIKLENNRDGTEQEEKEISLEKEDIEKMEKFDLLSDKFFEAAYSLHDPVKKVRVLDWGQCRATELSCKTLYDSLSKAHKKKMEELEKEDKSIAKMLYNKKSSFTDFDFGEREYKQMRCGLWQADECGVVRFSEKKDELACYHPITIVQILKSMETGKEKVKLAYKKGNEWYEHITDKGVIASANKIVGLAEYGISVTSETARSLVNYLSDLENLNIQNIERRVSTEKLGWHGDEFLPYGEDGIILDSSDRFNSVLSAIKQEGSFADWINLIKEIRAAGRFEAVITIVASFASVLLEPLNMNSFIVNLWGDTGKGKTVTLMVAASVWADPTEKGGYMADPKDTPTYRELLQNFLNNLPVMLDDMAKVKEQFDGDYSELVYSLCAGKGKGRANKDLGLNSATSWKQIILTNGEHSLISETTQGGAVNRVIDVEMDDGYIYQNGNKVVETVSKNYGFAGRYFVENIKKMDKEEIVKIYDRHYKTLYEMSKKADVEKEEKQLIPMAVLLTADEILDEKMFADGKRLDINKCFDILKDKEEVSENARAYDYIMSEIVVNSSKFDATGDMGECWGKMTETEVYIISTVFDSLCKKGNFSRKSFLNWARKKKYLVSDAHEKRGTTRTRINDKQCRCVCIKIEQSEDIKLETDKDGFVDLKNNQIEMPFN